MKEFRNRLSLFGSKNNSQEKKYLSVFTQLFAQMNISICDNTLSIYPKIRGVTICDLIDNIPSPPEKMTNLVDSLHTYSKGRFVYNSSKSGAWSKHNALHDDTFCLLDLHFHYELEETIDEVQLRQLLGLFLGLDLITPAEYDECVYTFNQAHHLQVAEYSALLSRLYLGDLKKSIEQCCCTEDTNTVRIEANKVVNQLERLFILNGTSKQVHQYTKDIQLMIDCPTHENIARLYELSMYKKQMQGKLALMSLLLMLAFGCLLEHDEKSLRVSKGLKIIFYLTLTLSTPLAVQEVPYFYRHYKWVNPPENLGALCQKIQQLLPTLETTSPAQKGPNLC